VIFIRVPDGGIPHAVIGFPGNLSPYQGMNAAGLTVTVNQARPRSAGYQSLSGRSNVQTAGRLLTLAGSLDEAESMIAAEPRMCSAIMTISDGNNSRGAIYELSPRGWAARRVGTNGVVYATNHFLAPETADMDDDPAAPSSLRRYDRLAALLEPNRTESLHGYLDPAGMIRIMRDRIDPWTGLESPPDVFDDGGKSLATHGCMYEAVFDPGNLWFWVAAGGIPVPQQRFAGFSLAKLAGLPNAKEVSPPVYP